MTRSARRLPLPAATLVVAAACAPTGTDPGRDGPPHLVRDPDTDQFPPAPAGATVEA